MAKREIVRGFFAASLSLRSIGYDNAPGGRKGAQIPTYNKMEMKKHHFPNSVVTLGVLTVMVKHRRLIEVLHRGVRLIRCYLTVHSCFSKCSKCISTAQARRIWLAAAGRLQAIISYDTANHPAHQRHATFTPACLALPSGTAPRKRTFHQDFLHCDITNVIRHTVCPHTRRNHTTLEANTSESSSATLFPALHLHYTNWPLLSPAPKSCFPYNICTTNWPLLSQACFPCACHEKRPPCPKMHTAPQREWAKLRS